MGFEFMFTAPQLTQSQWEQIVKCFEQAGSFRLIESDKPNDNKVSGAAYAFKETSRISWPEDFYLSSQSEGVYICFHAASSQQQEYVIKLLTECILRFGLKGCFEEM